MARGRKLDERWQQLARDGGGTFTTMQARALGLSNAALTQAVERGQIRRLCRGHYEFVRGETHRDGKRRTSSANKTSRSAASSEERFAPELSTLFLENFGAFESVQFDFCPGINVLIGENGTGKSYAMQAAYCLLHPYASRNSDVAVLSHRIQEKLRGVFRPDSGALGRLVRRGQGRRSANVSVASKSVESEVKFDSRGIDGFSVESRRRGTIRPPVFIPSRELLSIYEGFIGAYEHTELSFSEVYYDTCVALNTPLGRGPRKQEAARLLGPFERALGGTVRLKGDRFYVRQGTADLEAHLVSEGFRKIATLVHLINNGSLRAGGLLLWDEPEANLNPALIKLTVDFLVQLARAGVQVILATHDYLLANRLSILRENDLLAAERLRFFNLERVGRARFAAVEVNSGETLADLEGNSLLREYSALYDLELSGGRS